MQQFANVYHGRLPKYGRHAGASPLPSRDDAVTPAVVAGFRELLARTGGL